MSFSAVNMCRLVIAVIFISFVSCVLAVTTAPEKKVKPPCTSLPPVKASIENLMQCLNQTVAVYLGLSTPTGYCDNATQFGDKLLEHLNTMKTECGANLEKYNTTHIRKLIEFSLRNDDFKKFYYNMSCMESLERNISNTCVKGNVGFFNITKERKHSSWIRKVDLRYNSETCRTGKDVKNCVEGLLKTCNDDSRAYVASLFEYARQLENCNLLESSAPTIPPANGSVDTSTWLTTPVIITASLGAVVAVGAIIIIIVMKSKNK